MKDTQGAVSRAEGTLFIDEIDKLSLSAQVGLLRLLEEQRYRPLGASTAELSANVRFIAGTNADLAGAVRTGVFREDLYYRINVLPVKVPPLKDRVDEIVPWAEYMLSRRHSGASKEGSARLTPGAGHVLSGQPWPGNLRQLDNILRRAYALAQMGHDAPPKDVLLDAPHVERALAYEGGAEPNALLERMHQAAVAFVLEAERRQEAGMPLLDLDLADAMRGLILGAASEKLGNKEDAFRLVGKDSTVQSRNQQKILRRELEKVEALYREMGREGGSPFRALLGPDERG
ncbi:MAG: sigma 54-interacting transcriptional regulator [Polyangiaceae bacterium]